MTAMLVGLMIIAAAVQPAAPAQTPRQAELDRRGAVAMGFDQKKTTHEFTSSATGGSIEVRANDAEDTASTRQIRTHLAEIAKAFAAGDFGKPFQTHAEVPPGVPDMQRLKRAIRYEYADTPRGGIVRITTKDAEALAAIHAFLAYQRREHTHTHEKGPDPGLTPFSTLKNRPYFAKQPPRPGEKGSDPGLTPF